MNNHFSCRNCRPEIGPYFASCGLLAVASNPSGIVWDNVIGNVTGNDGKNSIVWHAAELGACGVWTDGTGNWISIDGYYGEGWTLQGCGDFTGDGKDDIVLFHEGTGSVVKFANGQSSDWESLGQLDAKDWFIVGAGDYDNDQKDDLLVRQYSTGMLGYYSAGDMNKWNTHKAAWMKRKCSISKKSFRKPYKRTGSGKTSLIADL